MDFFQASADGAGDDAENLRYEVAVSQTPPIGGLRGVGQKDPDLFVHESDVLSADVGQPVFLEFAVQGLASDAQ